VHGGNDKIGFGGGGFGGGGLAFIGGGFLLDFGFYFGVAECVGEVAAKHCFDVVGACQVGVSDCVVLLLCIVCCMLWLHLYY